MVRNKNNYIWEKETVVKCTEKKTDLEQQNDRSKERQACG